MGKASLLYSEEEVEIEIFQALLILHLWHSDYSRIKFKPRVIKVLDDRILFGMVKHYGVLSLSKVKLLEYL